MHVPYSFLTLGAAAACWTLAGLCHDVPYSAEGFFVEPHNPLAVCRSEYGSLIARLMKDSLHSYWHAGCTDPSHGHAPAPVAASAGRFAMRQQAPHAHAPAPAPEPAEAHAHEHEDEHEHEHASQSWVDRFGKSVSHMEHMRTARNSPFAVAPAHKRFLSAAADWRVHIAWELDPGDAALYEIDHFVSLSRAPTAAAAKQIAMNLARKTIEQAFSPHASPADALTGAGAAINLLNDQLQPGRSVPPDPAGLLRDWRMLTFCLNRHQQLLEEAFEEGWWEDIPEVRRKEIETYATMLSRISGTIRQQLGAKGTLNKPPKKAD